MCMLATTYQYSNPLERDIGKKDAESELHYVHALCSHIPALQHALWLAARTSHPIRQAVNTLQSCAAALSTVLCRPFKKSKLPAV